MKKLLFPYLAQTSRKGWLLLIVVLQLILMFAFHGLFPFSVEKIAALSGGQGIPDARMYYTYGQLQNMLVQYGMVGRHMYLQLQWVDMVYPLIYSTLLGSLLFLVYKKTRLQPWAILPFAAALFDYAENILLRVSVQTFPQMSVGVVKVAALATFTKWFLLFVAFFLLVFGAIWRMAHWFRMRKK